LNVAGDHDHFRSDLFARLSGFAHPMTSLRERREDIGLLAATLLGRAGARSEDGLRLSPEMGLALLQHSWPLNVRELEQVLVRSRLLSADGVMHADFGSAPEAREARAPQSHPATAADRELHARISEALAASNGNVSEAARTLGKGRVQVHRLIRRLRIDPMRFRT
jgi:DNA-binding NtrC family response regulator